MISQFKRQKLDLEYFKDFQNVKFTKSSIFMGGQNNLLWCSNFDQIDLPLVSRVNFYE